MTRKNSKAPPQEALRAARTVLGVILPVVMAVAALVASSIYPFEWSRGIPGAWNAKDLPGILTACFLFSVVLDWPFFVLAVLAYRRILKLWPMLEAAKPAIIGSLCVLLPLYGLIYVFIGRGLVYRQRGAMMFLGGMIVLSPILGGLAMIGWNLGVSAGRVIIKRNTASGAESI
jgi:hypothetical protein